MASIIDSNQALGSYGMKFDLFFLPFVFTDALSSQCVAKIKPEETRNLPVVPSNPKELCSWPLPRFPIVSAPGYAAPTRPKGGSVAEW